jgi:sterol-4alpha-carboxylate 3-dehydrogenase (decarboxylating)
MDSRASSPTSHLALPVPQRSYLVIGGSGFLGRYIVEALLLRGDRVRVLDLVQSFDEPRVQFVLGDIRSYHDVASACKGVETVFHCASLTDPWASRTDCFNGTCSVFVCTMSCQSLFGACAVNVKGAQNVISACMHSHSVRRLVYTSTASVVFDGTDIQNGDESMPYPRRYLDAFAQSKAQAERLLIAANNAMTGNTILTTRVLKSG